MHLVLLGAGAARVSAFEPGNLFLYQKGPFALKPQLELSETFNDNITYRGDHKKADLISIISPGFELQYGRKEQNNIDLRYFYDRLMYLDNTELDANQHRIALRDRIQKSRLTLDGSDSVDIISTPIGGGYSASITPATDGTQVGGPGQGATGITGIAGAKVDRMTIVDQYRLTWDMTDRTDLYLQALHSFVDYQDNTPLYDSRTLIGTLGFEYHPSDKTFFFGETYFGETKNIANIATTVEYPIANFIGFFAGARGQFTERLRGTAKAGYEHRYYSDGGDTLGSPVVEISVDAVLSERTLIGANYTRRQYESIQLVRSPYTTDSISAYWLQQIGNDGRLRSVLRTGYVTSNFEPTAVSAVARSDEMITASLTISYDIKLWMRAFGSYNFEHLNSNEPSVVDYNVNRMTLGLQFGY